MTTTLLVRDRRLPIAGSDVALDNLHRALRLPVGTDRDERILRALNALSSFFPVQQMDRFLDLI